jgi:hypothetical protein
MEHKIKKALPGEAGLKDLFDPSFFFKTLGNNAC